MTDGQRHLFSVVAAIAVVALALLLIAAAGVRFKPNTAAPEAPTATAPQPPATSPLPALQPPHSPSALAPPPSAPSGGVYRCTQGGRTTYSDRPCAGGTAVDVRPAVDGYALPRRGEDQAATSTDASPTPMQPSAAPPSAGRLDERAAMAARCEQLWRAIDQNDAAARAGGSAQMQDWLRSQRRKLEDERFARRC